MTMPAPPSARPPLLLLLALFGAASSFLPLLANAFGGVVIVRPPTTTSRVAVLRATTDRLARRRRHHHHPRSSSSSSSSRSSGGVSSTTTTTTTTTSRTATANGVEYTTDRYDDLISWFLSSDARSYVSPKIDIRPSTRGGLATGGYGTFARTDLEGGELLLRVPRSCCVTLDDALNDVECGSAFRKLMETAGPGADTVVIAGYLAKEYLLLGEYDRRLKSGEVPDSNAEMRRLGSIKFAPYLRTLPWERGVNAQEHVLFWEDDDVETLLRGSLAYKDAVETRATVKLAIGILDGIIGPVVRKARGENAGEDEKEEDEGFRFPWQQSREEERAAEAKTSGILDGLEEAVRGAFVISLSRAFVAPSPVDGGVEEDRLEPVLDMLQHSNAPNIRHRFVDDGTIEVTAGPDVKSGDELFNCYRGEDVVNSMPYHKFFTRFGFVPGVTEPVANLIAERSTIFFPQRAAV